MGIADLTDLLLTSAHRLSIEIHEELELENVSTMALLAMRVLARAQHAQQPLSPKGLAAALGASRAAATQVIDRLVRDGRAERLADPHDGRAKVIVLTDDGTATASAAGEALERCMRSFTESFTTEEREQLAILLDKLERGATWHSTMRAWTTYQASPRRQRRPPAVHIR